MLDIFNIPNQNDNIRIFYAAGTTTWQTWTRPRNCKFIWMICLGGGAAGGNGTIGGAGNGGGSGATVRALFQANVLPDILYVQPGPGGASNGASGNKSFVSIAPSSATVLNLVCTSGNAAAAGNAAESVATVSNAGLLSLGVFNAVAGQNATPANSTGTPLNTVITTGGGGGGRPVATPATPAGIAGVDLGTLVVPATNGGNNTTGGNGDHGFWSWKPMFGIGGAGGGNNDSGAGGNGGNGAYGCGGGGGGQGTTAGGLGGRGGDGLVIIATF